jgi:hypothetical protein
MLEIWKLGIVRLRRRRGSEIAEFDRDFCTAVRNSFVPRACKWLSTRSPVAFCFKHIEMLEAKSGKFPKATDFQRKNYKMEINKN